MNDLGVAGLESLQSFLIHARKPLLSHRGIASGYDLEAGTDSFCGSFAYQDLGISEGGPYTVEDLGNKCVE